MWTLNSDLIDNKSEHHGMRSLTSVSLAVMALSLVPSSAQAVGQACSTTGDTRVYGGEFEFCDGTYWKYPIGHEMREHRDDKNDSDYNTVTGYLYIKGSSGGCGDAVVVASDDNARLCFNAYTNVSYTNDPDASYS